jgi:predicted phage terminase large subunit-like protein
MSSLRSTARSLPPLHSLSEVDAEIERRRIARDADRIRARCKTLAGFVREAWHVLEPGNPYIHGWHIDAICEHLQAITDGRLTRLLINVPPGFSKSLLVSVFWPAWEWGPAGLPHLGYIATSYKEDFCKRDTRKMRDLVSSEWYRALWPHVVLTRAGELSFQNDQRGVRDGIAFPSLTGGRADRVLIDDPHSTETAESDSDRDRTTRIFRESVPTRLNNPTMSAIVLIMQRLHQDDLSGVIERLKLPYEKLILPMEFEPERRCSTSIGFTDPRSYAGELLFPERFPRAVVERDKIPMGPYAVAGQFQQRPAPRVGGMFERRWFGTVDAAPARAKRVRAWDLAATEKSGSNNPDFTAGVLMARDEQGIFYIEHVERFRAGGDAVERAIINLAESDPPGTKVRLPQDPGQAGKAQAQYLARQLAGHTVVVKPVSGSKSVRSEPLASQAAAGNVKVVKGPWNDVFIEELCLFPNGSNDDQADAAADAFSELVLGPGGIRVGTVRGHH